MTQPEQLTPRQFAERLGYKPHYGNQLKKDGRLVMAPDGKHVLLAESLARFEATKDPSRAGVAARHAQARAQAQEPAPEKTDETDDGADWASAPRYDFQNAKAKREHWAAEREHAAFRKEAGELIELSDHVAALADLGATVRAKLEAWASVLAPQLAGRDEGGVRAVIADQVELLLRELADAARKHGAAAGEGSP